MVSIPLFVLLLATYAYSVPVGINDNISKSHLEITTSKPMIMHLLDDGEAINVPTHSSDLQMTTSRSLLNKERAPHKMMGLELAAQGVKESSTLYPITVETSSQSVHHPRGLVESSTLYPTTVETSSQSEHHPRGLVQSSTLYPTTVETSSQSEHHPRGLVESSTWYPSTVETSTQFNEHKIRGQNVHSHSDLQTTEEPSSSVSSFAKTTGLLQNQRGEQVEEHESTSMTMDEATTEVSSTGRSNTVIEVIPGRNTKTEIIPGRHTETEIIPGSNTKTEIITSGAGRLVVGNRVLSQGKN